MPGAVEDRPDQVIEARVGADEHVLLRALDRGHAHEQRSRLGDDEPAGLEAERDCRPTRSGTPRGGGRRRAERRESKGCSPGRDGIPMPPPKST